MTLILLANIDDVICKIKRKNAYKKWAFPDKKAALKFINDNDKYVYISDKKKSELSALLFFSWTIEDDSDLENVVLKRNGKVKTLSLKE